MYVCPYVMEHNTFVKTANTSSCLACSHSPHLDAEDLALFVTLSGQSVNWLSNELVVP